MSKRKITIKKFLFKSRIHPFNDFWSKGRHVAILRYHALASGRINDYVSPNITLPLHIFESHIDYLSENCTILSMDDVADVLYHKKVFPKRSVAITFDDGYRDNYDAYKILRHFGVSGTFYVVAGCIEQNEPLWLFELNFLIQNTFQTTIDIQLPQLSFTLDLRSAPKKRSAIRYLTALIKSNNRSFRETIRNQLRDKLSDVHGFEERAAQIMLTWEQLLEMNHNGMIIGGHTMTHLNLPNAGLEDARREIFDCKKLLEKRLNRSIKHFSYPNGGNYEYYNDVIMNLVREAGFLTSTTSNNGLADIDSNALELRRVRVTPNMSEIHYQMEWEPLVDRWIHLIGKRSD